VQIEHLSRLKRLKTPVPINKCGNPFRKFNLSSPSGLNDCLNALSPSLLSPGYWIQGIFDAVDERDKELIKRELNKTLESFELEQLGEYTCKILLRLLEIRMTFCGRSWLSLE